MASALSIPAAARLIVPKPLRQPLKQLYLQRCLDGALRGLSRLREGEQPSRDLLEDLQGAWGNPGMEARTDYLAEVAAAASAVQGPVLECGSGLTTLLVGSVGGRRGIQLWSLEHLAEWRLRVARIVDRHRLRGVQLCHAPLRDYGDFQWYDAPLSQLPSRFQLVVCDGPPGHIKGGRYGLLPVMRHRLAPGCTILLDDVDRSGEQEVLRRWGTELATQPEMRQTRTGAVGLLQVA